MREKGFIHIFISREKPLVMQYNVFGREIREYQKIQINIIVVHFRGAATFYTVVLSFAC